MACVPVYLPQPQVHLHLFVLAKPHKVSQTSDQRADKSEPSGILEIYGIDQHQLIELLPLGSELTSHLVGKERTVAPATEHVRSGGHNGAHQPQMLGRDGVKRERGRRTVELDGFQRVERSIWSESTCDRKAKETANLPLTVQEEEWRLRATGLNCHNGFV